MNIDVWAFVSHLSFKLQKAVMPSTLENRKYSFYYTKKYKKNNIIPNSLFDPSRLEEKLIISLTVISA